MKNSDTISKTLIVAVTLCLICSAVISYVAVGLRDLQEENQLKYQRSKILASAGLMIDEKSAGELFSSIEEKIINLETGEYETNLDPRTFNGKLFESQDYAKDISTSLALSPQEDKASIKTREKFTKIYLYQPEDKLSAIIFPIRGLGLWGTLYGYLAVEPDFQTIIGLEYYKHKETPGLGGEVDNPKWKSLWKGKKIFSASGDIKITVIKGLVNPLSPEAIYQVDGLSGATITSKGVSNMLSFWLSELGYGPYIKRLKEEIDKLENIDV